MAKDNIQTVTMRGKLQYPKVLPNQLTLNYNGDGKEWRFDFELADQNSVKEIKRLGIGDRIKQKEAYLDGNPHLSFKQSELRKDGTPNKPIHIVDAAGNDWDPSTEIGNGTVADVKFVVIDNGKGKFTGVYPRSIRILDHVPYTRKEFDDLDENDEFYAAAVKAAEAKKAEADKSFRRDFGLEDDGETAANNGHTWEDLEDEPSV